MYKKTSGQNDHDGSLYTKGNLLPLPSHWTGLKGSYRAEFTYFQLRMVHENQFEIEILTKLLFQD